MNRILSLLPLKTRVLAAAISVGSPMIGYANDLQFSLEQLEYQGAFKLKRGTYGASRVGYANGKIAIDEHKNTLYFAGHAHHKSIAEFSIPATSMSTNLADIPETHPPIQAFTTFLNEVTNPTSEKLDTITGIEVFGDQLIVNVAEYYDAAADNQKTTIYFSNKDNLSNSIKNGVMEMQGAVHSAGWLSKIPVELQTVLGGDMIAGHASNLPIHGRLSMGPSAFITSKNELTKASTVSSILTTPLLNYSLATPVVPDFYQTNDLWTQESKAVYGFIVPNTQSYLLLGSTGGIESEIGYKITQDNGHRCGGGCAYQALDYYPYYWVYNVNDLIKVKLGKLLPHDLKPTQYGEFSIPLSLDESREKYLIRGADFNFRNNTLYVSIDRKDEQSPVVLTYQIESNTLPRAPSNFGVITN